MRDLFLDTAPLLHAVGGEHPTRAASRALIASAERGAARLHVAAETLQEFVHHRLRRAPRAIALDQTLLVRELCVVHPLDDAVIDHALDLIAQTPAQGRDAFIAATALLAGFDAVITTDPRFVEVAGLARLDPRDLEPRL